MSWQQQGKKGERERTLVQLVFVLVAEGPPFIGGAFFECGISLMACVVVVQLSDFVAGRLLTVTSLEAPCTALIGSPAPI